MTPAPLASEPQTFTPADARAIGVPGRSPYRTRISRRSETADRYVARAIPDGSVRAAGQLAFLNAVREHPDLADLRRDAYATVWEVARVLAWCASWETMTSRPTWEALCARTGRSRATIARVLVRLRGAGLLGVVATGRSGQYAPAARDAGAAEAAVYVLCTPAPAALAVDEDETPTDHSESEALPPHVRARQGRCAADSEPLRGRLEGADAPRATPAPVPGSGSRPAAPPSSPNSRQDERLAPARALQARVPVLRRITDRHVASVIREFVLAGWTTSELVTALDRRPDQVPWPHDGAAGVGNVGAWLAYRLAAWRDAAGTVRPSPGVLAERERRERIARQRADAERAAGYRPPALDAPGLAALRALIDQHRRRNPR